MTASPTPPDFFAESAKNPDHIVDANKMVSAGLPSEEEIQRMIRDWQMTPAFDGGDARIAALSTAILDLIRPAFEAKEREIERLAEIADRAARHWKETQAAFQTCLDATGSKDGAELVDRARRGAEEDLAAEASLDLWRARALSAETKLAQAVETRAKLDQRVHNQRVALRENWQIVEMRRRWLGSDTARIGYLNARRLAKGWRERALDAEATIQVLEARAAARGEKT